MISQYEKSYLPKLYSNSVSTDERQTKCYAKYISRLSNGKPLTALAEKFQKNWTEQKELELREMDDSLTNLNWLHNVTSIMGPQSPSVSPPSLLNSQSNQILPNIEHGSKYSSTKYTDCVPSNGQSTLTHHLDCALKDGGLLDPMVRYDYKNHWSGKPPFSYATLICMAMRELNKNKITLSDIYGWITDNFIYYRLSDSSWQNSVRHNLSLNKCFEKVPRNKDERGKGGFWRINPKYADRLESNLIKYRKQFPVYSIPKISSGLPAASTLLSRAPNITEELYQINESQNYYHQSETTDDSWNNVNYLHSNNFRGSQINLTEGSWMSKTKTNYLPNLSINNPSRAFNSSIREMASQDECSPLRKHSLRIPQIYRSQNFSKLQSLDEFRTSETGQKVDTQMRTDITPNQSPTMYSLLHQINSPPSHVSLDDIDSAASSSFDAELTANSGSCATYTSHSDDHEESLRFSSGLGEDFMVGHEDYLTCDSLRNQDNLFSQFI